MSEAKKFSDHTPEVQALILTKNADYLTGDESWHDGIIEMFKEKLKMIGFFDGYSQKLDIHYRGFWNQGDGAQFVGSWNYEKGSLAKVKAEFPQDEDLHNFAEKLMNLARKYQYNMPFSIKSQGHYQHHNCTSFNFDYAGNYNSTMVEGDVEDEVVEACRDYMQHIYKTLESEYEQQQEESFLRNYFNDSDTEFEADGSIA